MSIAVRSRTVAEGGVVRAHFRGSKLGKPVAGDAIWSLPTLVTLSPLGAPIAHAGLHVHAVVHDYQTDLFLPPHEVTR